MFQYKDVIDGLKSLSSIEGTLDLSHCQMLNFQAQELGFQGYHHFCQSLKSLSQDVLGQQSIALMRRICEKRLPSRDDCPYFEFVPLSKGVGYYSYWIGWDENGDEVRVPRPLIGVSSVKKLRGEAEYPIYVIETERELEAWQHIWGSTAYIPEELAKCRFPRYFEKEHLVIDNPPINLIKKKANSWGYDSNIASG